MRALLLLAAVVLTVVPAALAQTTCPAGTTTDTLAANNVRALLLNNGGLFWKGAGNVYNVPAAAPGRPIAPNALFAANLWVGGRAGTELRAAGVNYSNWDYYPGPLDAQGQPAADCAAQDRIYRITRADLDALQGGTLTAAVRDWPWRLGAPVVDGDGVAGNYNLAGGDRPELLGSETHWWVMHTMGAHVRAGSAPFPLEVQVSAFAVASPDAALNDATLYRYRFVWRGPGTFTEAFVGLWSDLELGNANDDYVGADSARAMVYGYNADNDDEGNGGYGMAPPAIGVSFAQLPASSGSLLVAAQINPKNDPVWGTENLPQYTPQTYLNRLMGLSTQGQPHPRCGDAFAAPYLSCGTTRFTFNGQPETRAGWTMLTPLPLTSPITSSDTRMMLSAGPFTFQAGLPQDVVFAITYARGSNHLDAVARLRAATDRVQQTWRTTGFRGLPAYVMTAPQAAPRGLAPTDLATAQHAPITFSWSLTAGATNYELEVYSSTGPVATVTTAGTSATVAIPDSLAQAGRVLAWRVRGLNRVGAGPWSATMRLTQGGGALRAQTSAFVDFLVTRNGAGALAPPEYGAFTSNGSGFPNPTTGPQPTSRQQASLASGVSAGWALTTPGPVSKYADWQRIVTRAFANVAALSGGFEWRFTGTSVAARPYDTGGPATMTVPFELWSTGTQPGAQDDVRMIPLVCEAACGAGTTAGTFDLGGDSPLSGGADDPVTDAVTWRFPSDRTPGQSRLPRVGGAGRHARRPGLPRRRSPDLRLAHGLEHGRGAGSLPDGAARAGHGLSDHDAAGFRGGPGALRPG